MKQAEVLHFEYEYFGFANVKLLKPNNTSLLEFDSLAFDLFENVK